MDSSITPSLGLWVLVPLFSNNWLLQLHCPQGSHYLCSFPWKVHGAAPSHHLFSHLHSTGKPGLCWNHMAQCQHTAHCCSSDLAALAFRGSRLLLHILGHLPLKPSILGQTRFVTGPWRWGLMLPQTEQLSRRPFQWCCWLCWVRKHKRQWASWGLTEGRPQSPQEAPWSYKNEQVYPQLPDANSTASAFPETFSTRSELVNSSGGLLRQPSTWTMLLF